MRRIAARLAGCLIGAAVTVSTYGQQDIPKDSPQAAVVRGSIVFATYCVLCHDANGTGNGRAARLYQPRPANLTKSPFPDEYKEMIIRKGGAAVGRSGFMPPWGDQLTNEQVKDVVKFLRTIIAKD